MLEAEMDDPLGYSKYDYCHVFDEILFDEMKKMEK